MYNFLIHAQYYDHWQLTRREVIGMDKNKKQAADTKASNANNASNTRTEFADEMNAKATQAKNNKQNNK